jgi:hypothetical protein
VKGESQVSRLVFLPTENIVTGKHLLQALAGADHDAKDIVFRVSLISSPDES